MSAPTHVVRWLPTKRQFTAITLPPIGIFIRKSWWCDTGYQSRTRLIRHERVHWQQAQNLGVIRYYVTYLILAARYGYDEHPMEIAARRA